jgi:hypothetical protein
VQIASETCIRGIKNTYKYMYIYLDLQLNTYITMMYGTMNIKFTAFFVINKRINVISGNVYVTTLAVEKQ